MSTCGISAKTKLVPGTRDGWNDTSCHTKAKKPLITHTEERQRTPRAVCCRLLKSSCLYWLQGHWLGAQAPDREGRCAGRSRVHVESPIPGHTSCRTKLDHAGQPKMTRAMRTSASAAVSSLRDGLIGRIKQRRSSQEEFLLEAKHAAVLVSGCSLPETHVRISSSTGTNQSHLHWLFPAPSHAYGNKQTHKSKTPDGNLPACSKRRGDGRPDGQETNHSEPDDAPQRGRRSASR